MAWCVQAVLLSDGVVMVAGGKSGQQAVAVAEMWFPARGIWIPVGQQPSSGLQFGLLALANDQALAFGGASSISQGRIGTANSTIFTQAYPLSLGSSLSPAPAPAPGELLHADFPRSWGFMGW